MSVTGESVIDDEDLTSIADEDDEDDDDVQSTAGSDHNHSTSRRSKHSHVALSALSGRCASIGMLMREGLLQPGSGVMTIEYMGQTFRGDLLADGQIRSQETNEVFTSPSSWAGHFKKFVNPDKKTGCGWSSVKYCDKKLEFYKNLLFKRRRQRAEENEGHDHCDSFDGHSRQDGSDIVEQEEKKALIRKKQELIQKIIVKYEMLGSRSLDHDPCTLIECVPFSELNKLQPFLVSVTSTALTVLGLHSHLTDSEVLGYLAGKWDVNSHQLSITHAFPCRCRLADRARARRVEFDIFSAIHERNLTLVGWYHSHPHSPATPTIRDTDQQLDYEMRLKGTSDASYTPCVGMIYSPHVASNNQQNRQQQQQQHPLQPNLMCYWVMPPAELRPTDYPRPLAMEYTVNRDACIHSDALKQMSLCVEYYRDAPDAVNFSEQLSDGTTWWQRLTSALQPCAPSGPANRLTDYLRALLFPRTADFNDDNLLSVTAAAQSQMLAGQRKSDAAASSSAVDSAKMHAASSTRAAPGTITSDGTTQPSADAAMISDESVVSGDGKKALHNSETPHANRTENAEMSCDVDCSVEQKITEGASDNSMRDLDGVTVKSLVEASVSNPAISATCIAESEGTNVPLSAESDGTNVPLSAESDGTNVPLSAESEGTNVPLSAESDGTNVPLSAESEGTNVPLSVESEGNDVPLSNESEGNDVPLTAESEGTNVPLSAESEGNDVSISADAPAELTPAATLTSETDIVDTKCDNMMSHQDESTGVNIAENQSPMDIDGSSD